MEEVGGIAALGIDWKILLAQLVNFLIVYFLLSKFAFKPLMKVLDERRKKVAESLETAQKIEDQKIEMDEKVATALSQAREEAQAMVAQTQSALKEERSKQRAETEKATAKMMADTKAQIAAMKKETKTELAREIGLLVVKATERIIEQDIPQETKKKVDEEIIGRVKKSV